jgi:hypothetical protein
MVSLDINAMNNNVVNVLERQLAQRQFEDILAQFNILSEWVKRNYSDVDFTVEFNDDSQNPITPRFVIRTRLFTGTDMTPEDRLLKKAEFSITEELFLDTITMNKWIKNIVPSFQKSIAKEVNAYYARNESLAKRRSTD